jgi:4-amino-4-deoxy-L-arabinose transferase-like glycosyltransferase
MLPGVKRLQNHASLFSVFFLAFFVRLIYNLTSARQYYATYDAAWYNHIAYSLVYQHCFCQYLNTTLPSISRPPLWPYILSLFYFLTPRPSLQVLDSGIQVFDGRLLLCFIGSSTCVLVYLLARDLFGKRIALVTGYIAAVYTGLFIYDGWLYTESLYTFLQTVFLYSLYRWQRTRQRRWIVLSGLSLGLATLARPNGAVLIAMLALWSIVMVLAKGLPWQTIVKSTLAITCIAAALVAPWTYRNYLVLHSFVLVSIGEGDALLGAYNDTVLRDTTGRWIAPRSIRPRPNLPSIVLAGHDAGRYTPQNDEMATDYALRWIVSHWRDLPRLLGEHFISIWTPYTPEENLPFRQHSDLFSSQVVWYMVLSMPIPIFLLALLGGLVTWRRWKQQLIIVYMMMGLVIAQNLVFYGSMRFRSSIEPLLVLLAGGAIWWLTGDEPGTLRYRRLRKRVGTAKIKDDAHVVQPKSTETGLSGDFVR